ncbi:hypothetical protein ASPBRDRAFT_49057 [Aspergillus brasiliensis CBS 101740]|uniref:Lysine-specific metallo-endopeptidase domain-containing protein n=1 Tax=Aspergillus brasiliensis (strain CBS 101740 / IMI 381727 / IBT 21946) TaxID=767769 RepID=A0A1L9U4D7_ASPBC|nr:hypothetical protein ASPBRDRAFT_49057 [Aspergillus brasiliensis CBS 101740]
MLSLYQVFSAGAALLLYSNGASAAPTARTSSVSYIEKYASCDASQVQKLEKAFTDVHTLVTLAETIDTSKHPWSNYFRTKGAGKTEDEKYAKGMWKAIASPNFKITVTCAASDNAACKSGSIAYADPTPGKNDMTVCPVFFKSDTPESKNNLDSRHMHAPEGERPSRKGPKKEYWCEDHKSIKWYEVAAQHILHEMTHFDSVGKQAGLPEYTGKDGVKAHGTDDWKTTNYIKNARLLATNWQKDEAKCEKNNEMPPYRNADNIAISALEWYFTKHCPLEASIPL